MDGRVGLHLAVPSGVSNELDCRVLALPFQPVARLGVRKPVAVTSRAEPHAVTVAVADNARSPMRVLGVVCKIDRHTSPSPSNTVSGLRVLDEVAMTDVAGGSYPTDPGRRTTCATHRCRSAPMAKRLRMDPHRRARGSGARDRLTNVAPSSVLMVEPAKKRNGDRPSERPTGVIEVLDPAIVADEAGARRAAVVERAERAEVDDRIRIEGKDAAAFRHPFLPRDPGTTLHVARREVDPSRPISSLVENGQGGVATSPWLLERWLEQQTALHPTLAFHRRTISVHSYRP